MAADDGNDSAFEGLSSLIRLSGANIPARARFVGETLLSCTLSSLTFGLACGQLGSALMMGSVGPLVPFLVGSWAGYSMGLMAMWHSSKNLALKYAKKYPSLMQQALLQEWDLSPDNKEEPLDQWIQGGNLSRMTMSILAAQTCRPSVEEIQSRKWEEMVDSHCKNAEGEKEIDL